MSNIIEARGLNKQIELEPNHVIHILKDINLKIEAGEFVSIMGPSGKSAEEIMAILAEVNKQGTTILLVTTI